MAHHVQTSHQTTWETLFVGGQWVQPSRIWLQWNSSAAPA